MLFLRPNRLLSLSHTQLERERDWDSIQLKRLDQWLVLFLHFLPSFSISSYLKKTKSLGREAYYYYNKVEVGEVPCKKKWLMTPTRHNIPPNKSPTKLPWFPPNWSLIILTPILNMWIITIISFKTLSNGQFRSLCHIFTPRGLVCLK